MLSEATEHSTLNPLSLIRRLYQKRGSAVLLLRDQGRRGEVHLHRGRIVRASCEDLSGEQALFGMLMWPNPRTWIAPLFELPEVNVFSDFFFLGEGETPEAGSTPGGRPLELPV